MGEKWGVPRGRWCVWTKVGLLGKKEADLFSKPGLPDFGRLEAFFIRSNHDVTEIGIFQSSSFPVKYV